MLTYPKGWRGAGGRAESDREGREGERVRNVSRAWRDLMQFAASASELPMCAAEH